MNPFEPSLEIIVDAFPIHLPEDPWCLTNHFNLIGKGW